MISTSFVLRPTPPFRLDLTVWVLRRRSDNAVDRWDGQTYRRVVALPLRVPEEPAGSVSGAGPVPVAVAVSQSGPPDDPRLDVTATAAVGTAAAGSPPLSSMQADVTSVLNRTLGLSVDLSGFYRLAAGGRLAPLAERFRGFKPPCFPTLFECLCNAIACQQITLTAGLRLLNRLAAAYGVPAGESGPPYTFPTPAGLAAADPEDLRSIGLSRQKAQALLELARAAGEEPDPQSETEQGDQGAGLERYWRVLAGLDDDEVVARLCRRRGVGRWTAEYTLLRGLGRLHVFPGDDVGARNNLQRWLQLSGPLDYEGVRRAVADWAPYAGLVYFSLLLDRLAARGDIVPSQGAESG